jgi:hypothetical protein
MMDELELLKKLPILVRVLSKGRKLFGIYGEIKDYEVRINTKESLKRTQENDCSEQELRMLRHDDRQSLRKFKLELARNPKMVFILEKESKRFVPYNEKNPQKEGSLRKCCNNLHFIEVDDWDKEEDYAGYIVFKAGDGYSIARKNDLKMIKPQFRKKYASYEEAEAVLSAFIDERNANRENRQEYARNWLAHHEDVAKALRSMKEQNGGRERMPVLREFLIQHGLPTKKVKIEAVVALI